MYTSFITPWNPLIASRRVATRSIPASPTGSHTHSQSESSWQPAMDITEDQGHFLIRADLPGIDPKDLDLQVEKGVLTIQGTRSMTEADRADDYHRRERRHGTFQRRFHLPEAVDIEQVEARSKHGVLEVSIPKQVKPPARQITVQPS